VRVAPRRIKIVSLGRGSQENAATTYVEGIHLYADDMRTVSSF